MEDLSGNPQDWSEETLLSVISGIIIGQQAASGNDELAGRMIQIMDEFDRRNNVSAAPMN